MVVPPPRKNRPDLEPNLHYDEAKGLYRFRNPLTGKRTWFTADKAESNEKARKANLYIRHKKEQQRHGRDPQSVPGVVDAFMARRVPRMPWKARTRANWEYKLNRIRREFERSMFLDLDRLAIREWLESFCGNADQFNKWRYAFVMLYRYAIELKITDYSEAEAIEPWSSSKVLVENQKSRIPLEEPLYWWVYDRADPFLRTAMRIGLVMLQGRSECVNMEYRHVRDDQIFIIREKTNLQTPCAFIRIAITDEHRKILALSREDGLASPHVVHRRPERRRKRTPGGPHWTYVRDEYLSKAFARLVRQAMAEGVLRLEEGEKPPSFHEIRGLGSRLYKEAGYSDEQVQRLMGHADKSTTAIYTEGGREALTDDHFLPAEAGLVLGR